MRPKIVKTFILIGMLSTTAVGCTQQPGLTGAHPQAPIPSNLTITPPFPTGTQPTGTPNSVNAVFLGCKYTNIKYHYSFSYPCGQALETELTGNAGEASAGDRSDNVEISTSSELYHLPYFSLGTHSAALAGNFDAQLDRDSLIAALKSPQVFTPDINEGMPTFTRTLKEGDDFEVAQVAIGGSTAYEVTYPMGSQLASDSVAWHEYFIQQPDTGSVLIIGDEAGAATGKDAKYETEFNAIIVTFRFVR